MDVLRCKTPELVRKEIWTHVLAYNLIRTIIAQAASQHQLKPREISFKGTVQTLEAFQPLVSFQGQGADLSTTALRAVARSRCNPSRRRPSGSIRASQEKEESKEIGNDDQASLGT